MSKPVYLTNCETLQLSRMDGVLMITTSDGQIFSCFLNEEGADKVLKAVRAFLEDETQIFNEDGTQRSPPRT